MLIVSTGYPSGTSYDGQREHDYGTTSSRGSGDSYQGVSSSQQGSAPLFRSSSDLQLDNNSNMPLRDQSLHREFGSADLVEAKHAGKRSYFHILHITNVMSLNMSV